MDENWGYPYFRKPPYVAIWCDMCGFSSFLPCGLFEKLGLWLMWCKCLIYNPVTGVDVDLYTFCWANSIKFPWIRALSNPLSSLASAPEKFRKNLAIMSSEIGQWRRCNCIQIQLEANYLNNQKWGYDRFWTAGYMITLNYQFVGW